MFGQRLTGWGAFADEFDEGCSVGCAEGLGCVHGGWMAKSGLGR